MEKRHSAVLSCVGAVIGAGFASGREVVTFFTQYGGHGCWLIALASLLMAGLCWLCMQAAHTHGGDWMQLVAGRMAKICPVLLMALTAGAMIAASGHMVALLWEHPQAYALGVLGTLLAAWLMGRGNLKMLTAMSGVLTLMLLCALLASLVRMPVAPVRLHEGNTPMRLGMAAVRAVGYAAMNMTLAIGVVCQSAQQTQNHRATAMLFGWMIGSLLMISQCVYSCYSVPDGMAFPLLTLLNGYGRTGYLLGVIMLYLAIATTLTSVLYALGRSAEKRIARRDVRLLLVLGVPLAVSGIGFEGIVDRLYAPAGLLCLFTVFIPMAVQPKKRSSPTFP